MTYLQMAAAVLICHLLGIAGSTAQPVSMPGGQPVSMPGTQPVSMPGAQPVGMASVQPLVSLAPAPAGPSEPPGASGECYLSNGTACVYALAPYGFLCQFDTDCEYAVAAFANSFHLTKLPADFVYACHNSICGLTTPTTPCMTNLSLQMCSPAVFAPLPAPVPIAVPASAPAFAPLLQPGTEPSSAPGPGSAGPGAAPVGPQVNVHLVVTPIAPASSFPSAFTSAATLAAPLGPTLLLVAAVRAVVLLSVLVLL